MVPVLDKDTIRYITQNITPEETQYVSDLRSTLNDNSNKDKDDDIIFVTKIMAFHSKINLLSINKTSDNTNYNNHLITVKYEIDRYREDICDNIQSIIGVIEGATISKLELPISDNMLEVLNELKICLNNWYELHKDDMEYEGCRYITSQFLSFVHKYIYLFRLDKVSSKNYADNMELPNPDAPVSLSF